MFFFFNDTPPPEIYPLSLHDALPICARRGGRSDGRGVDGRTPAPPGPARPDRRGVVGRLRGEDAGQDRKSTRLNSSHANISYAVFCLKKKRRRSSSGPTSTVR